MKRNVCLAVCLALLVSALPVTARAEFCPSARAAILVHVDTGEVLYEKNADEAMLVASTTKLMTALVTLEHCAPGERVTIEHADAAVEGSSAYLQPGESYSVEEVLFGLLLVSGNDAALALARHVAGSVEAFAELMNQKAAELGLTNSSFRNPHGLDAEDHYSCAADLARIMAACMENETFMRINSAESATVRGVTYVNHNKLLAQCEGVCGGKTGYTKAAGRSLVTCAEREGLRLICVTLGCPDDWKEQTELYDWAYSTYSCIRLTEDTILAELPVISGMMGAVSVSPAEGCALLLEKDAPAAMDLELAPFVFAPVREGEPAGRAVLRSGDTILGEVGLVYAERVEQDPAMGLTGWERFWRIFSLAGRCSGIYDLQEK